MLGLRLSPTGCSPLKLSSSGFSPKSWARRSASLSRAPCKTRAGPHDRNFLFDASLAALVLGIAAWTIVARGCFGAVVGYIAYGLFLALVWVRLSAVDVALTEAAIGSGVTGVLLIGAVARLQATEATALAERRGRLSEFWRGRFAGW